MDRLVGAREFMIPHLGGYFCLEYRRVGLA